MRHTITTCGQYLRTPSVPLPKFVTSCRPRRVPPVSGRRELPRATLSRRITETWRGYSGTATSHHSQSPKQHFQGAKDATTHIDVDCDAACALHVRVAPGVRAPRPQI